MDVKPCTCGHDPELVDNTFGWEGDESTTYYYKCFHCGTRIGAYDSKQEALEGWNKGIELVKDM